MLLKIWHRFTYTIVIIQFTIYTIYKDFASRINFTAQKVSKYRVISGPYFPVFRLNTEIYSVNLRIQSKYRKIWTRNNSIFEHFLRSDLFPFTVSNYNFQIIISQTKKLRYISCPFRKIPNNVSHSQNLIYLLQMEIVRPGKIFQEHFNWKKAHRTNE